MGKTSRSFPAPRFESRPRLLRPLPLALLAVLVGPLEAQAPGAGASLAPAAAEAESCRYRVVNWNAAGSDPAWNAGMDIPVANALIFYAASHQANVMTLQEVTIPTLDHLTASLPGWSCYPGAFGVDYIAICVDGTGTNFRAERLADVSGTPDPPLFWGYVQLEYEGALITSVHTRNHWDVYHVDQLHDPNEVPGGIVAGDYNYETPEINPLDPNDPVWYQTDPNREPTWRDPDLDAEVKIDHVLTIEEPLFASGSAEDKHGSNHRVVLADVVFQPADPVVTVSIENAQQPIEVDGACDGTVEFRIAIEDECCLDPNDLALDVMADNPTANATLGAVVLDSPVVIGPRGVEVTGRVAVSSLQSCPAEVFIEASAQDCAGNAGHSSSQGGSTSALVVDATPPAVAAGLSDLHCLWPPSHAMACFEAAQFSPVITDNCEAAPAWAFASCTSNQPDDGLGDGDTIDDCILDADAQGFCARAERAGGLPDGRRYGVAITATDACGNVSPSTQIGGVHVPHDQNPALTCVAPPID